MDENGSIVIFCSEYDEAFNLSMNIALNGYPNYSNKAPDAFVKVGIFTDQEIGDVKLNGIELIVHATLPNDLETFANRFAPFEALIAKGIESKMRNIAVSNDGLKLFILTQLYDDQELIFMSNFIDIYFKDATLPALYRYYIEVIFH